VNFGPLTAEICWRVWGTPANFSGLRILASLLHRRRSTEVNHNLHDVWPSPGLVRYIYIFGGSWHLTEFWQVQHSLFVQVLSSDPIFAALLHGTRIVGLSPTLRRRAEGATYIRQGGHHVGHRPTSSIIFGIIWPSFRFCSDWASLLTVCWFLSLFSLQNTWDRAPVYRLDKYIRRVSEQGGTF